MISPLRAMAGSLNAAALEALASRGLLRRAQADLEAGRVALIEEGPDAAEVQADGETVVLNAAGPARGRCTCPAAGVCRHALAALILLSKPTDGAALPDEAPPPADWSRLFEPLTIEVLGKFAGKAAFARALTDERALAAATVEVDDDGLAVKVGGESVVLLPGGGLEAAVCSGPERSRKLRVAQAVIAARRAIGLPELAAAPNAAANSASAGAELDARLLEEVRGFLARAYRSALVFAPAALEDEARRLAVAGRIEAVPRLAAALLRIAGAVAAVRRRSAESDPDALLALLAEAQALTLALEAADPQTRRRLIGTTRDAYDAVGDLSLFGLGAYRWEAVSGAHGLTAWFFEPAAGRPLSLTLARPDRSDPTFTPIGAYEAPVWGAALSRLATSAVQLADAQVSPRARLSTSKSTRAKPSDWDPQPAAIETWDCAAHDWTALEGRLQRLFASRLGGPAPASVPVVLLPHRRAPARFDELTQTLVWPIADRVGRWLGLTLANDGIEAERIDAIERLGAEEPFWAILALAVPEDGHIALKPYGLWGKSLRLLDFLPPPRRGKAAAEPSTGILSRLVRGLRNSGAQSVELAPDTFTRRLLERAWDLLLRRAELGRGLDGGRFGTDCTALADELAATGLAPIARAFRATAVGSLSDEACLNAAWRVLGARSASSRLRWMG